MISSNFARTPHTALWRARRSLPFAASAVAAVVLLSACTASTEEIASATAPISAGTVSSSPSSTSSASSSASPSSTSSGTSFDSSASATPTAESAVKKLVDGFPAKLIPLMSGAEVAQSSLQRSEPLSVASLTATVTAKSADVLSYYTTVFTGQGFTAQPGDAVDGVPLKTFLRANGKEIVTVSVIQTGGTSTVTIGANVLPQSLK